MTRHAWSWSLGCICRFASIKHKTCTIYDNCFELIRTSWNIDRNEVSIITWPALKVKWKTLNVLEQLIYSLIESKILQLWCPITRQGFLIWELPYGHSLSVLISAAKFCRDWCSLLGLLPVWAQSDLHPCRIRVILGSSNSLLLDNRKN